MLSEASPVTMQPDHVISVLYVSLAIYVLYVAVMLGGALDGDRSSPVGPQGSRDLLQWAADAQRRCRLFVLDVKIAT